VIGIVCEAACYAPHFMRIHPLLLRPQPARSPGLVESSDLSLLARLLEVGKDVLPISHLRIVQGDCEYESNESWLMIAKR
jgi:hypothetical protein